MKKKNMDENKDLINVIKSRLVDLENEIEEMSGKRKEIERLYGIEDIAEKIIYFNNQNRNQ